MSTSSQNNRGGVRSRGGVAIFHTGETSAPTGTAGTDTTPVVTETYISRVFLPVNATLAGIALLNGSAVAGNVVAILYDPDGVPIAQSAATAQAGTNNYQDIPFTAPAEILGPGRYFIGLQFNNVAARFRTHTVGRFGASKKTGETFGTATAITPPTTFTTGQGPIASTY